MIYYRYLFNDLKELSPNEGLVYSALLSHSLRAYSECYNSEGKFSVSNAIALVEDFADEFGFASILYSEISTRRLSGMLNMKEETVKKIKESLEEKHGLIDDDHIKCPLGLLEPGYMEISKDIKLKGRQLTFYARLREKAERHSGVIDTWSSVLAEQTGITKAGAKRLLAILEDKGYAKRLDNGKLMVL